MNLKELSNLNASVAVMVSLPDLREFFSELVSEAAASQEQSNDNEVMLSADEVCKALSISANSLWRWGKSGYLRGSKVGRKVYYRKSDVDTLLKGRV